MMVLRWPAPPADEHHRERQEQPGSRRAYQRRSGTDRASGHLQHNSVNRLVHGEAMVLLEVKYCAAFTRLNVRNQFGVDPNYVTSTTCLFERHEQCHHYSPWAWPSRCILSADLLDKGSGPSGESVAMQVFAGMWDRKEFFFYLALRV
jgi:hypothetical protein